MDSTPERDSSPEIFTSPGYRPGQTTPKQMKQTKQTKHVQDTALTTPSTRAKGQTGLSDRGKRRVGKATESLTRTRCLIENTDESNVVDHAHIMPNSTEHEILSRLEYNWNMEYLTLNVHTRYNIAILGTKFHRLMDKKHWFLLPEEDIINDYFLNGDERSKFPKYEEKSYKYTVIARDEMILVPIYRQGPPPPADAPLSAPSPAEFTHNIYPYTNLEKIISHVHPRFAIFKAGLAMGTIRGARAFARNDANLFTLLVRVFNLYQSWIIPVTDEGAWKAFTEDRPGDGDGDNYSTSTHTRARSTRSDSKKRPGPQGGSPTPSAKRSRGKGGPNDEEVWLDTETLRGLDEELPSNKSWAAKVASIMSWAAGVEEDMCAANETEVSEYDNEASPVIMVLA